MTIVLRLEVLSGERDGLVPPAELFDDLESLRDVCARECFEVRRVGRGREGHGVADEHAIDARRRRHGRDVGGPIVSPGAPTVLIAGLPAAAIGSMCVCVGPPDSVIMGSPTVLVGGRPLARMMDPTAHGGMIMAGAPTVMVGP